MGRLKGDAMHRFGLIGWPVAHSLSPAIHAAALRAAGMAGEYRLYPIPPGRAGERALRRILERLRQGELHGLNVTIPHKRAVLPRMDGLTPAAAAAGAVNTILRREGGLVGENTDIPAFLADLRALGASQAGTALVLGAGGAARAVVLALLSAGWAVFVAARSPEKAESLAAHFRQASPARQVAAAWGADSPAENPSVTPIALQAGPLGEIAPRCTLIVNCTPLGMAPQVQASPWPAEAAFPPAAAIYDLVYNPAPTALVRAARQAGLPACNGLGMLVEQAALAFEAWSGAPAGRSAMLAAAREALQGRPER